MSGRYLGRLVASAIVTIVMIVLVNFVLFRLMPGSPERALLRSPHINPQVLAEKRAQWGLDKPLFPDQLVDYVAATAQGDLGFSIKFEGEPVVDVLATHLGPTLLLFGLGEILAAIIGLTLGAYTGWRRGGPIDLAGNGVSLILYSMPYFVIGMALLVVFSTTLGWFPASGMSTLGAQYSGPFDQAIDFLAHFTLPLVTVTIGLVGQYSILMRSSIIETLREDYVTTARAKGLREGRILRSHALPNALLPAVTLVAINLGYVVAGAITVEVVFNWPGLGSLTVDALTARDYPLLQGAFLLLSVTVVAANLIADILYGFLDPRVRT
ncbi:MAG TPA: ABC transporter permease [Candidatus Binatia bacterium]|nr:ABC transporter permease [Candidatus Binatia bacterium]